MVIFLIILKFLSLIIMRLIFFLIFVPCLIFNMLIMVSNHNPFGFRYFTERELFVTTTGLDNVPTLSSMANLTRLFDSLDVFREYFGSPIKVNSAFRCPSVNMSVGGVSNSDHLYGFAADITCPKYKYKSFDDFVKSFEMFIGFKNSDLHNPFTQCIIYDNRKFIHVSINPKFKTSIVHKL